MFTSWFFVLLASDSVLSQSPLGLSYSWSATGSTYRLCAFDSLGSCYGYGLVYHDSSPTRISNTHPSSAVLLDSFWFFTSGDQGQDIYLVGLSLGIGEVAFNISLGSTWSSLFYQGDANYIVATPQNTLLIYGGNTTADQKMMAALYELDPKTGNIRQITAPQEVVPIRYGWSVLHEKLGLWLVKLSDGWYGYDIRTGNKVISGFKYNDTTDWQDLQGPVYDPDTNAIYALYISKRTRELMMKWTISESYTSEVEVVSTVSGFNQGFGCYYGAINRRTKSIYWAAKPSISGLPTMWQIGLNGTIMDYANWSVIQSRFLSLPL